jgi:hypothetical protein
MPTDIFEFWSRIGRGEHIHPADKEVIGRISPRSHGFRLECLPACFSGPLRNAKVVLLYLSPGFHAKDIAEAKSEEGKDFYFRRYKGYEPLPDKNMCGFDWAKSRTALFGEYEKLRGKIAILNIGAYHSEDFQKSYHTLAAFPSSRACLDWAQSVLFPEALQGKRIVICLRAAHYWGLETGRSYDGFLFAPPVNRGGYLLRTKWRDRICKLAQDKIGM